MADAVLVSADESVGVGEDTAEDFPLDGSISGRMLGQSAVHELSSISSLEMAKLPQLLRTSKQCIGLLDQKTMDADAQGTDLQSVSIIPDACASGALYFPNNFGQWDYIVDRIPGSLHDLQLECQLSNVQ